MLRSTQNAPLNPHITVIQIAKKLIGRSTSQNVGDFNRARLLPELRCFSKPSSSGFDFMPRHYSLNRCAPREQAFILTDFSKVDWTLNGN